MSDSSPARDQAVALMHRFIVCSLGIWPCSTKSSLMAGATPPATGPTTRRPLVTLCRENGSIRPLRH